MRKFSYAVCMFSMLTTMSFSQQRSVSLQREMVLKTPANLSQLASVQAADTLGLNEFFNCSPTLFLTQSGFVAGSNEFGDLEKMQFFQIAGTAQVTEILVWFGGKTVSANPGNVVGAIYSANAGGAPLQVMDSTHVTMASIDTSGSFTSFLLAKPVTVDSSFFAGIIMSTAPGDLIGMVSTDDGCNAAPNSWERWSDGTWHTIESAWTNSQGLPLKIDFAIFPVVQTTATSVQENGPGPESFTLQQNYPNPFNPTTSITYSVAENTRVKLTIYNLAGQEIRTLVNGFENAGTRTVNWDGYDSRGRRVASGIYLYRLSAGTREISKKMLLLK